MIVTSAASGRKPSLETSASQVPGGPMTDQVPSPSAVSVEIERLPVPRGVHRDRGPGERLERVGVHDGAGGRAPARRADRRRASDRPAAQAASARRRSSEERARVVTRRHVGAAEGHVDLDALAGGQHARPDGRLDPRGVGERSDRAVPLVRGPVERLEEVADHGRRRPRCRRRCPSASSGTAKESVLTLDRRRHLGDQLEVRVPDEDDRVVGVVDPEQIREVVEARCPAPAGRRTPRAGSRSPDPGRCRRTCSRPARPSACRGRSRSPSTSRRCRSRRGSP